MQFCKIIKTEMENPPWSVILCETSINGFQTLLGQKDTNPRHCFCLMNGTPPLFMEGMVLWWHCTRLTPLSLSKLRGYPLMGYGNYQQDTSKGLAMISDLNRSLWWMSLISIFVLWKNGGMSGWCAV